MATVAEIWALYTSGRISEAMDKAKDEIRLRVNDSIGVPELRLILAWCHYRRKEYDAVRSCLNKVGDTEGAQELWATLAAYVDKDDARLRKIIERFPGIVAIQNAVVIRARDPDSTITHTEVSKIVLSFSSGGPEVANLSHNGARFFLAKARDEADIVVAVGMLDRALRLYGTEGNWHHRAAATHWQSVAFERLGKKEKDRAARTQARQLWERAVELDPGNQGFSQNLKSAKKREAELAG